MEDEMRSAEGLLFLIALLVTGFDPSCGGGTPGNPDQQNTAVSVKLEQLSSSNCQVQITLKNVGSNALNIFRNDLPWVSRHSILFVVVPLGPDQKPLDPELYVD